MYSSGGCFIQGDFVFYTLLYDNMLNGIIWHLFNLSCSTRVKIYIYINAELNVTIQRKTKATALLCILPDISGLTDEM